jgi:hypothetical protein
VSIYIYQQKGENVKRENGWITSESNVHLVSAH